MSDDGKSCVYQNSGKLREGKAELVLRVCRVFSLLPSTGITRAHLISKIEGDKKHSKGERGEISQLAREFCLSFSNSLSRVRVILHFVSSNQPHYCRGMSRYILHKHSVSLEIQNPKSKETDHHYLHHHHCLERERKSWLSYPKVTSQERKWLEKIGIMIQKRKERDEWRWRRHEKSSQKVKSESQKVMKSQNVRKTEAERQKEEVCCFRFPAFLMMTIMITSLFLPVCCWNLESRLII